MRYERVRGEGGIEWGCGEGDEGVGRCGRWGGIGGVGEDFVGGVGCEVDG